MTIGEQIKQARKRAGLTQVEVSEAIGICNSLVSRYEATNDNALTPPVDKLEKMSKLFGVNFVLESQGKSLIIETDIKRYTIWKNNWPIGEISLYQWQASQANDRNKDVHFAIKKEEDEE